MSDNGAYMASGLLSLQTSENDNELYASIGEHTPSHPSIRACRTRYLQPVDASEFIPDAGRLGLREGVMMDAEVGVVMYGVWFWGEPGREYDCVLWTFNKFLERQGLIYASDITKNPKMTSKVNFKNSNFNKKLPYKDSEGNTNKEMFQIAVSQLLE